MRRLLLIDDDERLGPPLAAFFQRHGLQMQQATRPGSALALLAGGGFDAVILDVMLPEMDGFEVCRRIRHAGPTASLPVIMLTARGEVMDRVVGLELGADDYLPKPFEPRELLARIQTVLRRVAAPPPAASLAGALRFEGLHIDLDRRSVQRDDQVVELTSTEFELLVLLATTPGKVYSRDDILGRLRGQPGQDIHSRAVDILVSRLRKKLEPLDVIHTLRNAGYLFAGARL
ncbi:MAG: response regulator transcription factor [Rubrivivax sp.]|nr:response regulator transcription factor [Rubrivivax sp.]